jgi:hypothetical protein
MTLVLIFLVTNFVNSKKNGPSWFPSHHDFHYLVLHVNLKVFQLIIKYLSTKMHGVYYKHHLKIIVNQQNSCNWKHNQRNHLSEWTLLKIIFYIFEKLQREHNGCFCSKLTPIYLQNFDTCNLMQPFCMFKTLKPLKWTMFFSNFFFFVKCAPFFSKLEMILSSMVNKTKGIKIDLFIFTKHFNTFGKCF